jgi:hypothetical protein
MKDNKVNFKQALKKQILLVIVSMATIIAFPFVVGLNTDLLFYGWIIMTITMIFGTLNVLKKQAKEALCPHCNVDLFEVIQMSKYQKVSFNYCPSCGNKIEL